MTDLVSTFLFTLLPIAAFLGTLSYLIYQLIRADEKQTGLFLMICGFGLVLGVMFVHQLTELVHFITTGSFRDTVVGELPETTANMLAAGTVVYALRYIRREQRHRTQPEASKQKLSEVSDRLELIFENVNDGILLVDLDAEKIRNANKRACEMLRYSREELLNRSPYDIHPHDSERFDDIATALQADGGLMTEELSCRRRDGTRMPAAISASRLTADGSDILLVTLRDTTRQSQLRTQIDLLGRVLRHNLRNDLNVVMGWLETIEADTTDSTIATYAADATEKCRELYRITENTRKLNEIIQQEQQRHKTQTDLIPLVKTTVKRFEQEYPSARVETDMPMTATARVDSRFQWAIEELVENALVHADADPPTVQIQIVGDPDVDTMTSEEWVTLTVADTGPEIPASELQVLNDDSTRTALAHGSGLGLWVVSQLVQLFEGELVVDQPADGQFITEIMIRLPPT